MAEGVQNPDFSFKIGLLLRIEQLDFVIGLDGDLPVGPAFIGDFDHRVGAPADGASNLVLTKGILPDRLPKSRAEFSSAIMDRKISQASLGPR